MTNRMADMSLNRAAGMAGFGYLIIIIGGLFAEMVVRSQIIVWGDAAATAANIMTSGGLYRAGIISDLIMLVSDVVVALALYVLLKPVNKSLALLAAFFRLVHSAVNGFNLLNMLLALVLLSGADYLKVFSSEQLYARVMFFLEAHNYGYLIALVFFACHCLILGYLIIKSDYIPSILGVLMIAACGGYLIDSLAHFLMPNYTDYANIFLIIVAVPAIVAELSLCLWLIIKGKKLIIKIT